MTPLGRFAFHPHRRRTAAGARGRTLEIGVGTGLNLDLYENARLILGIDPDPEMMRRACKRAIGARQLRIDGHHGNFASGVS